MRGATSPTDPTCGTVGAVAPQRASHDVYLARGEKPTTIDSGGFLLYRTEDYGSRLASCLSGISATWPGMASSPALPVFTTTPGVSSEAWVTG